MSLWCRHTLKLVLSMLPQPAVVDDPRQSREVLTKTKSSITSMELPPRGPVSVALLFVDTWDSAESAEQLNSHSYVSLRPKIHTLTAGVGLMRLGGQGYVQGCAQQQQEEHRPAACYGAWSRVPALLQPRASHLPVTTGLLVLTPSDLPHSTHRSFPNGTKRRNNLPKPGENHFGAKPTEVRSKSRLVLQGMS